jgi:hypothetical protein
MLATIFAAIAAGLGEHDLAFDLRGQIVQLTTMFQRSICPG